MPARDLAHELGRLGLLGMHLTGYGCAGTSATAYGLACLELEAGDSGLRSLVSVQGSLAMFAIWKHGSEEQKQEWLPRMADRRGDRLLRADRARLRLRPGGHAHPRPRDGDDWVLDRQQDVDHQRLRRRRRGGVGRSTDDGDPRLRRAHRHPGLLRARDQAEAVAAGLGHLRAGARRRPAARRRDAARGDAGSPGRCPASTRPGSASSSAPSGAARDCLETTIAYAREREIFDKPLAGLPAHPGQARRHGRSSSARGCCSRCTSGGSRTRAGCGPSRSASAS